MDARVDGLLFLQVHVLLVQRGPDKVLWGGLWICLCRLHKTSSVLGHSRDNFLGYL